MAEPLVEPVRGYIERFPAVHCFETPNLLVLAEALAYPVTTPDASSDVPALPLEDSTAQPAAVGLQQ